MLSHDDLEAAGYLFERSHGRQLTPGEASIVEQAKFASARPDEVADSIWRALEKPMPADLRLSAYWALGKLGRDADKKRFVDALRRESQREIRVAYQIMIALDNLGEPVFSRRGVSHDEDELNRRDAMAYLAAER